MEINYFTFRPDDHYGYAEIDRISESSISPIEEEDAIEIWVNADYSWDHDEDEGGDGEGYYNEYGYNDLYGNTYLIGHDGQADAIINTGLNNFDGTENEMSDIMMHDLSLVNGVEFVICLPSWSGEEISIYIKGEKNPGGNEAFDVDNTIIDLMSGSILNMINKGDLEKAADNFLIMSKFNGVDDMIKSKITEEEYSALKKMTKGKGIASRFGLY
jgi:hypothetical protein